MAYEPFLIAVLTDVVRVLHEHRFDYALVGGLAYSALVEPRATMDLDLLIVVEGSPPAPLFQALEPVFDAVLPHAESMPFPHVNIWRVVGIREQREMIVDFLLAESEFHRAVLQRKRVVDWFGAPLPVVTPEDLLLLKALSGRVQDQADILRIKAVYGPRLDRAYLTVWKERLGVTLEVGPMVDLGVTQDLSRCSCIIIGARESGGRNRQACGRH